MFNIACNPKEICILHPLTFSVCEYVLRHTPTVQDRFATSRSPPAVDELQDWTLVEGEEEGGFTILEFTRKYITCDKNDLPITVSQCSLKVYIWLTEGG